MRARWLTLAAVLLLGCGTIPAPSSRPGVSAPPPTPTPWPSTETALLPQCLDPGVELSVGEGNGAMGLRAVGITLRNCGTQVYTVHGYPVLDVLDADRNVLDVTVVQGISSIVHVERYAGPPKRIDVPPGGKVSAMLVWRNLTTDAATVAKGEYLSVAPASGQPRHTLPLNVDPGNTGRVAVSPWTSP
jgi:hypothetical protein